MVLRLKDAHGNIYDVQSMRGVGVEDVRVEENEGDYTLEVTLTDGRVIEAGALPPASPVGTHTHGNLTYSGKIGNASGKLIETGDAGVLKAGRRLVCGTTPPASVTGLSVGDIYLYYQE